MLHEAFVRGTLLGLLVLETLSLPFTSVSTEGIKIVKTDNVVPRRKAFHTVRIHFKVVILDGLVEHGAETGDPVCPTSTTSGDENLPNRI